jgi:WD40 repeat protein
LGEDRAMSKKGPQPKKEWRLERAWAVEFDDYAQGLALSPDGALVAAGTLGGAFEILRAADGVAVREHASVHGGQGVLAAEFTPKGDAIATAGEDGHVCLWDAATGDLRWRAAAGKGWVEQLAFSADGKWIAASCGKTVSVFDASGALAGKVEGHASTVTAIFWHPFRKAFFSACYGGLQELDLAGGKIARSYPYKGSLLVAAPSPDGKVLASGNQDGSMHVWFTGTTKDLEMSGYQGKIDTLAWGEGGPLLACADGPMITVWNFGGKGPAGSHPLEIQGHEGRVHGIAFRRGGTLLLSVGEEGTIHGARRDPSWGTGFVDQVDVPLRAVRATPHAEVIVAAGDEGKLFGWFAAY